MATKTFSPPTKCIGTNGTSFPPKILLEPRDETLCSRCQHICFQDESRNLPPEDLRLQDYYAEDDRLNAETLWDRENHHRVEKTESPPPRPRVRLPAVTGEVINLVAVTKLQDELDRKNLELRDLTDTMELERKEAAKAQEAADAEKGRLKLDYEERLKGVTERAEAALTAEEKSSTYPSMAERKEKRLAVARLEDLEKAVQNTPGLSVKAFWEQLRTTSVLAASPNPFLKWQGAGGFLVLSGQVIAPGSSISPKPFTSNGCGGDAGGTKRQREEADEIEGGVQLKKARVDDEGGDC